MMLTYRIGTWAAILILAFGSTAVFVVFLVTALRQLRKAKPGNDTARLK